MQSLSPAYIKTPARAILPQNGAQEGKQVTTKDFREKTAALDGLLGVGQCFDMTARDLTIGGRAARLWVVNGYAQEDILERVIAGWQSLPPLDELSDPEQFCRRYVSACDAQPVTDRHDAIMGVFAGKTLVVIDGFTGGLLLDVKHFPTRSVEEPDTSRVLRGSHDGFVENLMQNAALLRRRIRDPHLRLERIQLPERSATDVALCYMEGEADEDLLRELREKLAHLQAGSIAMSQESIVEAIAPRQFWNPFPTVRYTERPDVATACIMEGDVVMLVDNSPAALLLPTTLLRFNEEINDYYFPPLIGTYLQVIRTLVLLLTMFITPLWYLLVKNPDTLHESLHFLLVQDEYYVPLIIQLLLVELIIDVLKIASLNTPDVLSNSFSMLGALILGADAGFDWRDVSGALDKLDEETGELRQAVETGGDVAGELGDVLFAAVKVGRFCGIDPEDAVAGTCEKFIRRFRVMEQEAARQGRALHDMTLEEMTALWNGAKERS